MNTWIDAHNFLFDIKPGEGYYTSTDSVVTCTKRTKKRIHLSNGVIITIKEYNGMKYLHSGGFKRNNKHYPYIDQVLRDIEGYLIFKIHESNNCWR